MPRYQHIRAGYRRNSTSAGTLRPVLELPTQTKKKALRCCARSYKIEGFQRFDPIDLPRENKNLSFPNGKIAEALLDYNVCYQLLRHVSEGFTFFRAIKNDQVMCAAFVPAHQPTSVSHFQ